MRHSVYIFLLCLTFGASHAQEKAAELKPAETREIIRQWVQTEQLAQEEAKAWQIEQQRMSDLLELYEKELNLLNEEIAAGGASQAGFSEKKAKLESELSEYRAAKQILKNSLEKLKPRVLALTENFPSPLKDELITSIESLQNNDASSRDSLRDILEIINAAARFNRTITLSEEVRDTKDGRQVSVNVLYLGLGQAYYAARTGTIAGYGKPNKNGWTWSESPEIADAVRNAIAIYRTDKQPQFIQLPISIGKENTE